MTGNLVTAGYGIAAGYWALVRPTATAVAACVAGELLWARLLRRPCAANRLLLTELTLFLLVFADWLAAGSQPQGIAALALLALVSVALGGQSMWALRIHQTTTYFTGMLTKTISAAATGRPTGAGTSVRQLAALLAGAALGGAALHWLRPAATVLHVRATRAGSGLAVACLASYWLATTLSSHARACRTTMTCSLPFHPWALAMLAGTSAVAVTLLGRPGDAATCGRPYGSLVRPAGLRC